LMDQAAIAPASSLASSVQAPNPKLQQTTDSMFDANKDSEPDPETTAESDRQVPQDDKRDSAQDALATQKQKSTSSNKSKQKKSSSFMEDDDEKGGGPRDFVGRLVLSNAFEIFFACLIVMNTLVMALEAQYNGYGLGSVVGYPNYTKSSADTWPGMKVVFETLDWTFGFIFTAELLLKIVGLKRAFTRDCWNWFDSVIVVGWLIDSLGEDLIAFPIDPMMLRLARLARLLRLLKLAKSLQGFDPLFLMMTTLRGSLPIVFWAFVLIFSITTMVALFLNQVLVTYFLEVEGNDPVDKRNVFKYFGTFSRSVLTLFELTLGNWVPVARTLVEGVSEWFMIFSLVHKLTMGLAVLGVVNGIFIKETFNVAATDDLIMLIQKQKAQNTHAKKMKGFFAAADKTGDGSVDPEEFSTILSKNAVRTWFAAQELDASDAGKLFTLLDGNRNGELTADEMVKGVGKLKGAAKGLDMLMLMNLHKDRHNELVQIHTELAEVIHSIRSRVHEHGEHLRVLSSVAGPVTREDTIATI